MNAPDPNRAPATSGSDVAAAPVVDVDGGTLECVRLLLLLRQHVQVVPAGTLLRVSTQDPIAGIDLPAWCALTGHTWLGPHPPAEPGDVTGQTSGLGEPSGPARFVYGVRVEAHAQSTHPQRPWRVVAPLHRQVGAAGFDLPALDRSVLAGERR
jgi:tRNA 2-thiouridine synthesizing protein A